MILEDYLVPDLMLRHFTEVTPELLIQRNIRGLICDIDNTLATYEQADPPPEVVAWCKAMREAKIRLAFVSNNGPERVSRFNKPLGFPIFPDAKKPFGTALVRAMQAMGTDRSNTAVLGDQLLTDNFSAKREGLTTIIVPPIKDKKTLLFRLKRWIETPYVNAYRKKHTFS